VDVSAEQVALARKVSHQVELGSARTYLEGHPDGYFRLITMFDVIEHLTKAEILDLMDLLVRKLSSGGVFIAHCPNADSPMAGQVFAGDLTHETLLNPASAAQICALAGLKDFEAREHLGTSSHFSGKVRALLWRTMRCFWLAYNLIETGSPGSRILTRNFAFRAISASGPLQTAV
jgi:SAM-dependent methyltransferase